MTTELAFRPSMSASEGLEGRTEVKEGKLTATDTYSVDNLFSCLFLTAFSSTDFTPVIFSVSVFSPYFLTPSLSAQGLYSLVLSHVKCFVHYTYFYSVFIPLVFEP